MAEEVHFCEKGNIQVMLPPRQAAPRHKNLLQAGPGPGVFSVKFRRRQAEPEVLPGIMNLRRL